MKLTKGTQILLQLHLLNSGSSPITDTSSVTMQLAADPSAPFTQSLPFDADVAVTATAASSFFVVGQNLTYTVTVVNNGPEVATGVAVLIAPLLLEPRRSRCCAAASGLSPSLSSSCGSR